MNFDIVSQRLVRALNSTRVCIALLLGVFVWRYYSAATSGDLIPKGTPDSPAYVAISQAPPNLELMLTVPRPPVYPAVLAASHAIRPDYGAVGIVQYLIFTVAVFVLFFCYRRAGFKPWETLLLTVPLASAGVLLEYGNYVMPEITATSLAMVALGISMIIAAKGISARRLMLLSLVVFATCLTRPAFLFLPFVSPLAILLVAPVFRSLVPYRSLLREFAATLGATLTPLLAYAILRLFVVGHFGIVSFGGIALAGLGTSPALLTTKSVEKLPTAEMRGLGRAIIAQRARVAVNRPPELPKNLPAYVFDEDKIRGRPMIPAWTIAFDPSIYFVALPAVRDYYKLSGEVPFNPDVVTFNRKLSDFSFAVLNLHKTQYARWIWEVTKASYERSFHNETGGRLLTGIALMIIVAGLLWHLVRGLYARSGLSPGDWKLYTLVAASAVIMLLFLDRPPGYRLAAELWLMGRVNIRESLYPLGVLFFCVLYSLATFRRPRDSEMSRAFSAGTMAMLFFMAGVSLISLVEMPLKRYVLALSAVLPGAVLLVSVHWIKRGIFTYKAKTPT